MLDFIPHYSAHQPVLEKVVPFFELKHGDAFTLPQGEEGNRATYLRIPRLYGADGEPVNAIQMFSPTDRSGENLCSPVYISGSARVSRMECGVRWDLVGRPRYKEKGVV